MIKQERQMRSLADIIEMGLQEIYGSRMAFVLNVAPFEDANSTGDYISNMRREDAVKVMRVLADNLESGQDIPVTQGNA